MPDPKPRQPVRSLAALIAIAALTTTGCQAGLGPLNRWRMAGDKVIAPPPTAQEVGDTRRPLARILAPEKASRNVDSELRRVGISSDEVGGNPGRGKANDQEIDAEFQSAMKLFEEGKLSEAEKLFARLDRKKNRGASTPFLGSMNPGRADDGEHWARDIARNLSGGLKKAETPLGESVMFFLAESQYRQGKLVAANDTYGKLAATYAWSDYMPKVAEREYAIALDWLAAVDPETTDDRREKPGDRFNGRLPAFDVKGHALQVLEHVRHHDPEGPYADDAVMRIADFHFKHENYEDASVYYDQFIEDHPKSPMIISAHVKSIDAKLRAYIGPDYDSSGLEDARKLIRRTMSTFPERDPDTDAFLRKGLTLIDDQQAEMTFRHGEFYRQTGYPGAAELSYAEVRARWPKSEWAEKAKTQLELVARAPRKKVEPSKILTSPGAADPHALGAGAGPAPMIGGGMGGMGGAGGGMGGPGGP